MAEISASLEGENPQSKFPKRATSDEVKFVMAVKFLTLIYLVAKAVSFNKEMEIK